MSRSPTLPCCRSLPYLPTLSPTSHCCPPAFSTTTDPARPLVPRFKHQRGAAWAHSPLSPPYAQSPAPPTFFADLHIQLCRLLLRYTRQRKHGKLPVPPLTQVARGVPAQNLLPQPQNNIRGRAASLSHWKSQHFTCSGNNSNTTGNPHTDDNGTVLARTRKTMRERDVDRVRQ